MPVGQLWPLVGGVGRNPDLPARDISVAIRRVLGLRYISASACAVLLADPPTAGGHHDYMAEAIVGEPTAWTFDGERLTAPVHDGEAPAQAERVHAAFRAVVLDPEYPCLGSRSVLQERSYRFGLYGGLASRGATPALARDLAGFVGARSEFEGHFSSFIAVFESPKVRSEMRFEKLLWRQLAALHAIDDCPWDASVSADPASPEFSFSFAGTAFFVVGLNPASARWARTFPWPVLVFNAHEQFEQLREDGRFDRMSDAIRERDTLIEGAPNPNLAEFGSHTEARQYAGREVPDDWHCPVTFRRRSSGSR